LVGLFVEFNTERSTSPLR